ncbi:deoxynucleoside triphosphate triphosphohydrolase SAMHD1-like [Chanos chanos]|uniref:Deoxynucleoside triphosphate triphosphohydrolase SAMHD1-like n=1 Tax=Chanos chanos TaxID=29144 RepID=A0A6J2WNJ6_CHACN|nr:deoxynucleoside triphosphate triphosphohydrolase SAMHD1-like [Chanos chanos]
MSQQKIFNDPIHGYIEMPPLCVEIIDTPQFQRLRNIKQLGGGYFVYPGASHNRFEHSIGVCHLAGKLIKILKEHQPDLGIDDKDAMCVQIAGLCHDLGHGPFSHVFEVFMRDAGEEQYIEWMKKWEHEEQSVKMFEALLQEKTKDTTERTVEELMFADHNFTDEDFEFIKALIKGEKSLDCSTARRAGTRSDKPFLYEIVANKTTGIDVNKMDYLSRDCHHLGIKCNFDHERYMMFARVCDNQICVRDKEARNMYELFHAHHSLHSSAYQHPVKKLVEQMIVDALLEAERAGFQILGINKTITEAVEDEKSYLHLTDDVLQEIMRLSLEDSQSKNPQSKVPDLSKAEKLIKRIQTRKLYQCIGTKTLEKNVNNKDLRHFLKNISKILEELKKAGLGELESSDFDVLVSHLLPSRFTETKVMLYYKGEKKLNLDEDTKNKALEKFWDI